MGTALGIRTVSSALQSKIARQDKTIKKHKATTIKRKAATRKFGTRLANRTMRVAANSIAAIPAESIPFIGVAVLIADTGYELYAACETVRDLDQLYVKLGVSNDAPDDAMHGVCDPRLPDPGEVWGGVVEDVKQGWESLVGAVWLNRKSAFGQAIFDVSVTEIEAIVKPDGIGDDVWGPPRCLSD
jgi:hypothetical protein